jgi:hypothetical protein
MLNLRLTAVILLGVILGCQSSGEQSTQAVNARFELGAEQTVNQSAMRYVPDGGLSFINRGGVLTLYVPASRETYRLRGSSLETLPNVAECVFGPSYSGGPTCRTNSGDQGFDQSYAAPGSVLEVPDSSDLIMVYHGEDQRCGEGKTSVGIGLARSSDSGLTWRKLGQIIGGKDLSMACRAFTGAGNPNAIFRPDGYVYVYYVDWSGPDRGVDEIHVARAPTAKLDLPSAWMKYNASTGWTGRGLDGPSTAVIHRAEPGRDSVYAGLPHVSFNTTLERYLVLMTSRTGFYTSTSPDGLHWEAAKLLWAFPNGTSDECRGASTIWYRYASLLSPEQGSQQTSSDHGYLYYARGVCGATHQMVRRSFRLVP